jgi:hypothetical protein
MTTPSPEADACNQPSKEQSPSTPLAAELATIESPEQRLRTGLQHMRRVLSLEGKPDFRTFWDVRHLCIGFFREGIHPAIRSQLWEELRDMTAEARRLRDHLCEQADFASDQIELAINALQLEIEKVSEAVETAPPLVLPLPSRRLELRLALYDRLQREIDLLTSWAGRINGLRQELVKTEMRVGRKTKLFRMLSLAGDRVFPRRKESVQRISEEFTRDVEALAQVFAIEPWPSPFYVLRDEIRSFQAFAKKLSINSQAFTASREVLSTCWDQVRAREEQRKQEQAERQEIHLQQLAQLTKGIQAVREAVEGGELTITAAGAELERLEAEVRVAEVGSRERKQLRAAISGVRRLLDDRLHSEKEAESRREVERTKESANLAARLEGELRSVQQLAQRGNPEGPAQLSLLLAEFQKAELIHEHRSRLKLTIEKVRAELSQAEENQLLRASEGKEGEGEVLRTILAARKQRRAALKERVEALRRRTGASGFDFGSAMAAEELLQSERAELAELDAQIDGLRGRLRALDDA